jgi:hypothetical protein
MSPFRFLVALLTALALLLVYLDPGNPQTPIGPPASTQAPMVATTLPRPTTTTSTSSTTTTSTLPPDLVKSSTPCQEWLPIMIEVGWPLDPKVLERALKIMYRESRCQPWADSGPDHGLFQINQFWSSQGSNPPNWLAFYGIAPNHDALFDPTTNIRAALALYIYSVEQNGDGWHPWRFPATSTASTTTTPPV